MLEEAERKWIRCFQGTFCHLRRCFSLHDRYTTVLVSLPLQPPDSPIVCAWVFSPPSVGPSAWAPPPRLPYFIRGHQPSPAPSCTVSVSLLPARLSPWLSVPQAHSLPSSRQVYSRQSTGNRFTPQNALHSSSCST